MRIFRRSLFLFLLATWSVAAFAGWEDYEPRSFAEIKRLNEDATPTKDGYGLTGNWFASRVHASYTGKIRPVPESRRSLIELAFKAIGRAEAVQAFKREILVVEDSEEYWLPVQDVLIPHLTDEVPESSELELYAVWIGTTREGDSIDWVFLVNEFQGVDSAGGD